MVEAVVAGVVAVVGALSIVARRSERRAAVRRRAVVEAAGLHDVRVGSRGTITGRDGALTVAVELSARGSGSLLVTVRGLAPYLRITRPDLGSRIWEAVGSRDLEIGDPEFDAAVTLNASSRGAALSLLDADTRAAMRAVFGSDDDVSVAFGDLSAHLVRRVGRRPSFTAEALRAMVALGHRLEAPGDPEARLARMAADDPLPAVRARALLTLTEVAPMQPATHECLRGATRDDAPQVRLLAARALGAEGEPVLQALAADAQVADAIAAEAIEALGARFETHDARVVLARSAEAGHLRTAVAALAVVAKGGNAEVPSIAAVLARARGGLAVAATEALAAIGAPSAEPSLREALHSPEPDLAAAAARALARCGTVTAVPDLKEAEGRGGDVKRAARTAIAAIQSRLTGATPGQVSLAGASGEVSLVDATDGRVSLKTDEPAR